MTKLLTAYAVLVAVEEGAVEWDTPAGPDGSTVRHLIAHTSGLAFRLGPDAGRPRDQAHLLQQRLRALGAGGDRRGRDAVRVLPARRRCVPLEMAATTLPGSPAADGVSTAADLSRFAAELRAPTLLDPSPVAAAVEVAFPGLDGLLPGFGRQRPNDWGLGFEIRDGKSPHWTGSTSSPRTFGHFGQAGDVPLGGSGRPARAPSRWPTGTSAIVRGRSGRRGPTPCSPRCVEGAVSGCGNGFYSLLFLAQALRKLTNKSTIRIDVVTSNVQEVTGEETLAPEKITILGPCRVIPRDITGTVCRTMDVIHDSKSSPDQLANQLVAELLAQPSELTVAYRGRHRWVQTFEPIRWEQPVDAPAPLRERGVYLITGGLGGVGLQLAEHLARTVRARLVLTGRSSLPPKQEWDSYLSNGDDPNASIDFSYVNRIEERIQQELSIKLLNTYPRLQQALNQLCSSYVYDYFRAVGITLDKHKSYRADELKTRLGVLPKFEKFYQFMLRVLAEDQVIRLEDGRVYILKNSDEVESPEKLHGQLESQYPAFKGLLKLLQHCARNYPEALSGKIEAIGVLYPDGSSQFLNECEKNTVEHKNGRIYQLLLREVIDSLVGNSHGRKLRILEVGGGRGSLTRSIAPLLKDRNVEYHFTDIGKTFVVQAEAVAKKSGFDFMKFGLLDISKDAVGQGYEPSSFDIIFGLDVVHATPRIEETVHHLKGLLSPKGHLLLVEGVRTQRWTDMVWGLAEGWWYFTDSDLRTATPLLTLEKWEEVFRKQGFEVQGCPRAAEERSETDSALIIGRKRATSSSVASNRMLKVKELEELGAEVLVASADVSNYDQMRTLIAETKETFGEIHGVIHAAGIEGGGLIQSMTREKTEQEFAAKVKGTLVLDSLFENEKLDFFVLCSAHSAITGSLGQVAYCAANSFLDGFANYKGSQDSNRTVSVNWGRWKSTGMAVGVERRHKELTGEDMEDQMTANEGVRAFTHLLSAKSAPQLIVSTQNFQAIAARSIQKQKRIVEKVEPVISSTQERQALKSAHSAPDNEVEKTIAGIWQEVLGVECVASDDNFFELGGDSLIAIQILSRLRKCFEVDLPVTTLFDAPTVSDLALLVVQKQLGQVDGAKLADILAEIKRLSKDEIAELLTSEKNLVGGTD